MQRSLQHALHEIESPANLPWPLPMAHLTVARWFEGIASDGRLTPRRCKVFGRKLLYLSYGGVFYRTRDMQTENASELPLAFLFGPEIVKKVGEAYPFDSGAMAGGRFGTEWTAKFSPFERDFRVVTRRDHRVLANLVYHLWGNNRDYLHGNPNPRSESKPEPFPLLYRFFAANLSSFGVDHRQRTIECLIGTHVRVDRSLLWVGYPNLLGRDFVALCQKTRPWVPDSFAYESHRNFNPGHLAQVLEKEAAMHIERFASRE